MVPPDLGGNLENIKTEPKMAGTDPTLNTLIDFNAPLPEDDLFCPKMSCTTSCLSSMLSVKKAFVSKNSKKSCQTLAIFFARLTVIDKYTVLVALKH